MASDIPETYASSAAMANALASYIDNPKRVRRIVLETFNRAPSAATISAMRAAHLRPREEAPQFKAHEGYYPVDASKQAERANELFLARLKAEREASEVLRVA